MAFSCTTHARSKLSSSKCHSFGREKRYPSVLQFAAQVSSSGRREDISWFPFQRRDGPIARAIAKERWGRGWGGEDWDAEWHQEWDQAKEGLATPTFAPLNPLETTIDSKNVNKQLAGSVLGGAALVAGNCIGGGVLAVPIATAQAGFLPSATAMTLVWGFFLCQGLLLAEVTLAVMKQRGGDSISVLGIATSTLGERIGSAMAGMYLLFCNAVLVGQLTRGSDLLVSMLSSSFQAHQSILVATVAGLCYSMTVLKNGTVSDKLNTLFTATLLGTFCFLMSFGLSNMNFSILKAANWAAFASPIPVLLQVMSFMSIVPFVCTYFKGDAVRVRQSILLGSTIPLVLCVAWDCVMKGLVGSLANPSLLSRADPVSLLLASGGPWLKVVMGVFAASAVVTTLLGTYLSLNEFHLELLTSAPKAANLGRHIQKALSHAATVLPSVLIAALAPEVFFAVINISGTYFVPFLFCITPPIMAWHVRYRQTPWTLDRIWRGTTSQPMLPGGKSFLFLLAALSVSMILFVGEYSVFPTLGRLSVCCHHHLVLALRAFFGISGSMDIMALV